MQSDSVKEKAKQTNLERYGVENPSYLSEVTGKRCSTMLERYGVRNSMYLDEVKEKIKQTNLERYGVENPFQSEDIKEKIRQTNLSNLGVEYPTQSEEVRNKVHDTNISRYGVSNPIQSEVIKERIKKINQERYGVDWTCQRQEARVYSNNSKPNKEFSDLLRLHGITYEREFHIGSYSYDFKIEDILIEINPSVTHNVVWQPFGDHVPYVGKTYHYEKSKTAEENGYHCIHVFDWDDRDKIINLLSDREFTYARKCVVRDVPFEDCTRFLSNYHIQGFCRGQDVRVGLYYQDELVSVMTFGKPRYNKNYQYELLRYCSSMSVIGGAMKLFSYFLRDYTPESVISYCDRSKFRGDVYSKLGFSLVTSGKPSKHWFGLKDHRHITDNLLRQRGFDQLFNESYGKGTSNEELIISRGYVPVYDCGQAVYSWRIR